METSRSFFKFLALLLATSALVLAVGPAMGSQGSSSGGGSSGGSGSTSGGSSSDSIVAPEPSVDDSSGSQGGSGDSTDNSGDGGPDTSSSGDDGGSNSSGDSSINDEPSSDSSHDGSGESSSSGDNSSSDGNGSSGSSDGSGDDKSGSDTSGSSGSSGSGDTRSGSGDDHHGSGSGSTSSSTDPQSGLRSSTTGSASDPKADKSAVTKLDNSGKGSQTNAVSKVETHMEIAENEHGDRFRKGEVVLMSSRTDMGSLLTKGGLKVIETFKLASLGMNGFRVAVPAQQDEAALLKRLKKLDPNAIATFNHIYMPARGTQVALSSQTSANPTAAKPTNARIGLVDARVDGSHPLLSRVSVSSRLFGLAGSVEDNHGTAVASRIAQAAPGASLYVASVFSEMQSGGEIASVDAIVRGLDWLSRNNVPVINLSLTGPANPILQAITAKLVSKGYVLVAAVGNEGPHAQPQYPAAYDGVVGVTAVDDKDQVYLYANQGSYVDFAAKGVNTQVATKSGQTESASGTSFAAPVIAVALARMISRPDKVMADNAERELAKRAKDVGAPGRDPVFGYGIIAANGSD